MNKRFWQLVAGFIVLGVIFPGSFSLCHAQYTNGIYAEFNTSMGSYTCRLEYTLAPKTVANFIGLATGQRAWLDETSGLVKTNPIYNGIIFHRVVSNFVNQAGSPLGQADGGPGYVFVDEFSPSLRHDSFGVLSMANTGPDSNGSQWFNIVVPRPDLDDHYSAFGRLYGGSNVVYAINRVPTDASEKPLTNIFLNTVVIRRVGAEAQGFDINTNGLPLALNLNLQFARSGANAALAFTNQLYADTRLYDSQDLVQWRETKLGLETAGSPLTNILVSLLLPQQFFRAAQAQYPSSTFSPRNVKNRTLAVTFTNGISGVLTAAFNGSGGGTFTYPTNAPGTIDGYVWTQVPYRGFLYPIYFSGLWPMRWQLNFASGTNGSLSGVMLYLNAFAVPVGGTFTLSP